MLGRIARQLAGQAARRLASNAKSQQTAAQQAAPREPAMAALFAQKLEAGPTWDRMDAAMHCHIDKLAAVAGRLGSQFCVAAVSGVGRKATTRAVNKLLALSPKLVVTAGLAVAQDERLRHGDVLFADRVCTAQQVWKAATQAKPWSQWAPTADCIDAGEGVAVRVHQGGLLTTDQLVRSPSQRRQLAEQHQTLACDLESAWVVAACEEARVPWLAIRVVCDELDDELPAEIATVREQSNSARRLGAAAGALFREPGRALDLWKGRQSAVDAAEQLAGAMAELFRS